MGSPRPLRPGRAPRSLALLPVVAGVVLVVGACALLGVHLGALPTALLSAAAIVLAAPAIVLAAPAVVRAARHARLARQLGRISRPGTLAGEPVGSIPGAGPMVAGLIRPKVYCDQRVSGMLAPGEQRAVLLHERAHQRGRDPARLVALEAIEHTLGRLPRVGALVASARARLEIRADAEALASGATRPDLARALLRLSDAAVAGAAGFATLSDQRLAALLDPPPPRPRRRWPLLVSTAAAGAGAWSLCMAVSAAHHVSALSTVQCLLRACAGGA